MSENCLEYTPRKLSFETLKSQLGRNAPTTTALLCEICMRILVIWHCLSVQVTCQRLACIKVFLCVAPTHQVLSLMVNLSLASQVAPPLAQAFEHAHWRASIQVHARGLRLQHQGPSEFETGTSFNHSCFKISLIYPTGYIILCQMTIFLSNKYPLKSTISCLASF